MLAVFGINCLSCYKKRPIWTLLFLLDIKKEVILLTRKSDIMSLFVNAVLRKLFMMAFFRFFLSAILKDSGKHFFPVKYRKKGWLFC